MFEFLEYLTTEQAIASVYYALRILRHGKKVSIAGLPTEPSRRDAVVTEKILAEIERVEGDSLPLRTATYHKYTGLLADLLARLVRQRLAYDRQLGPELLDRLRRSDGKKEMKLLVGSFGATMTDIPATQDVVSGLLPPLAAAEDGLDLEFSLLLAFDALVFDRYSVERLENYNYPGIKRITHSLRVLEDAGFLVPGRL